MEIKFKRRLLDRGNSTGLHLPPELLEIIDAEIGDTLSLSARKTNGRECIIIWKDE